MVDRRKLFGTLAQTCDKYKINRNMTMIVAGGASLFYGLREETNDIDVFLESYCFDILCTQTGQTPKILPGLGECMEIQSITVDGIDFFRVVDLFMIEHRVHKEFLIQSKLALLRYRIALGRDKDVDDIIALKSEWRSLGAKERRVMNQLIGEVA